MILTTVTWLKSPAEPERSEVSWYDNEWGHLAALPAESTVEAPGGWKEFVVNDDGGKMVVLMVK